MWLPSYLDWFALGMAMAVGSAWIATGGRVPSLVELLGRRPWLSWLLALGAYWLVTQLGLALYPKSIQLSATQDWLRFVLTGLAAALLRAARGLRAAGPRSDPRVPSPPRDGRARPRLLRDLPVALPDSARSTMKMSACRSRRAGCWPASGHDGGCRADGRSGPRGAAAANSRAAARASPRKRSIH